ncbi:hypothetical protein D1AOALGA4SA_7547 [Olavius algarvensis Delta 1 endosymbiont]|nr:hypothetical protein D1AOALGA4SA_7547 [Olavius algarvensis Delta 1 endosymbiont]
MMMFHTSNALAKKTARLIKKETLILCHCRVGHSADPADNGQTRWPALAFLTPET